MPAAKKMCDIYGIKEGSMSARDVIKASLPPYSRIQERKAMWLTQACNYLARTSTE